MTPDPRRQVRGGDADRSEEHGRARVAIAISSAEAGGIQKTANRLGRALSERYDVRIVSVLTEPRPHFDLPPGVAYEDLGMLPPRSWRFAALRAFARMRRRLHALRPDVVVCLGNRASVLVLAASRGSGIPVIASERNDPRLQPVEGPVRWLRPRLYRRAAAVVVQTASVLSWAREQPFGERTVVIPNAVEPTPHVARPAESRAVVGLGRLVPQKGFDLLVEGFARVADRFPEWRLVIGGDGPERARLERLAADFGIEDRVTLAGTVHGAQRWLSEASVLVLPSRYEGFPNVLLEGMSVGLACVASRCPSGPEEILAPGTDGLLFDVDDVDALAGHLEHLLADPGLRQRLGAAARETVRRYDPTTTDVRWEQLVEHALGRS